jgi:CMP-N-acetylneuraminic acid synthetase
LTLVAWTLIKSESVRVPGKNFRGLAGKPLFAWILETLDSVLELDRIIVNTDAPDELRAHGLVETERLVLRERRPELRGNEVSANQLFAADLPDLEADSFLLTHATNPFLRAETIRRALETYARERARDAADSLFSVSRRQLRTYSLRGAPLNHDPARLVPTQALEPWLEENSCLYLFSRESFETTGSRIGERPILFETPKWESVDIDDEEDWDLAVRIASGLVGL